MEEERIRILKMLEEGKINAEEAAKLIDALDRSDSKPTNETLKKKLLHIQVDKNGERHVDVKVPLSLLKFALKFAPHHAKINVGDHIAEHISEHISERIGEHSEIDIEEILRMAQEGFEGKLLEVHDRDDNEHVTIKLE